ncbi:MAG: Basic proline-rich protein [Myxococcaceae bacterium]|nr:Basic proline-rich protein [Myxococcaceae bacterium]
MLDFQTTSVNARTDSFEGLHVLLVTEDDARAQAIAKSLRERKAHVGDVRAGAKDPVALRGADLLVIDARRGASTDARVQEVRSDVRARWASVATIDYTTLAGGDGTVDLRALEGIVSRLAGMDKALTDRARKETSFETTLAPLGPTRTLRALALAGPTLHVELSDGTLTAQVDLADELLVAAFADRKGERWEAHHALARVLGMTDANVVVQHRAHPAAMNIMEPVDQALEGAAQERARAPQLFEEEQLDEISGLRGERKDTVGAISGAASGSTSISSAAAQSGSSASVRPRASGAPQVIPAPAAAAVRGSTPRPNFADTPTDPAAPGLLQRMARAPENDGEPVAARPVAKPISSPAPVLSVERDNFDDEFEGEENYDAGEVTVVADASQLDILRETLGRLDAAAGPQQPLTSTMPAPPGPGKEVDERAVHDALKGAGKKPTGDWPTDFELPPLSSPPPAVAAAPATTAPIASVSIPPVAASASKPPASTPTSKPPATSTTSHAPAASAARAPTLRLDGYPERPSAAAARTKTRAYILVALLVMAAIAVGAMYWTTSMRKAASAKARARPSAPAKP